MGGWYGVGGGSGMAPGWVWGGFKSLGVGFVAVRVEICRKLMMADGQKIGPGVGILKLEIST